MGKGRSLKKLTLGMVALPARQSLKLPRGTVWWLLATVGVLDTSAFLGGAQSFADPTASPRNARATGVGVNWWLNANVKWVLDYEVTQFEGGAANNGNRPDERALTTRFALTF